MANICNTCDTKCRLKLCDGKEEDFQFCFRRAGSLARLNETITPFDTLEELYTKSEWVQPYILESLYMEPHGDYMSLLMGKSKFSPDCSATPIGYVTKG